MPVPAGASITTVTTLRVGSGSTLEPFIETTALSCEPPTFPPPQISVLSSSMSEFLLTPRSLPHAGPAALAARKVTSPLTKSSPALTSFATPPVARSPRTSMPAPPESLTMAHGCTVTVAGATIAIGAVTRCTVPAPAQVSSAVMSAACVTTVPFSVTPQTKAALVVQVTATKTPTLPIVPDPDATTQVCAGPAGWVLTVTL